MPMAKSTSFDARSRTHHRALIDIDRGYMIPAPKKGKRLEATPGPNVQESHRTRNKKRSRATISVRIECKQLRGDAVDHERTHAPRDELPDRSWLGVALISTTVSRRSWLHRTSLLACAQPAWKGCLRHIERWYDVVQAISASFREYRCP
jgi:hypothetical protein